MPAQNSRKTFTGKESSYPGQFKLSHFLFAYQTDRLAAGAATLGSAAPSSIETVPYSPLRGGKVAT
ncbi:hypothetical protein SAMN05445850_6232 [Paraburkholderia tuberum]|uniref:Uncharacterized protein n=1 Tax=Paraburkholderia tuberum TaxID=157910 RepID=A0A1H1K0Y8_9BURK|nr:hypothetical protein SAMN05445850_6232 [Paraburkholderia tuberum]